MKSKSPGADGLTEVMNLRLSKGTRERLAFLAALNRRSAASMVRELIDQTFERSAKRVSAKRRK